MEHSNLQNVSLDNFRFCFIVLYLFFVGNFIVSDLPDFTISKINYNIKQ